MIIKANGIKMNYKLSGKGKCLVLIHGFSDNMNMWFNQLPEFSRHFQVLTYDVRGFGKTEITKGNYSMDLFADDLYELLKVLGIKSASILGYSMGGRIALEFCMKYPGTSRGLILANSVVREGTHTPDAEERSKMMLELIQKGDNELISEIMTVNSFSPAFKEKNPKTFKKYKDIKLQNDPSGYIPVMMGMGKAASTPVDLNLVKCPVLILAGTVDNYMAVNLAEEMHKKMKGSILKIFLTGHATAIEAPKEFNKAVLEFMNKIL